jgi:hypothetical protein
MRKVKLQLESLDVESFPTVKAPEDPRGTIIAHRPTYCPLTGPLPATYEYDTCWEPSNACPPESCA